MNKTLFKVASVMFLALLAGAAFAKSDIYEQAPGFRGIEYGSQPNDKMKPMGDPEGSVQAYTREPDSPRMGYGHLLGTKYYFDKKLGFFRAVMTLRPSQNDGVIDGLIRKYGDPTQRLPLGDTKMIIWLQAYHHIEMDAKKKGTSTVTIESTSLAPQVDNQ